MLAHRQTAGLLAAPPTTILPSIRAAAAPRRRTVCASPLAESYLDHELIFEFRS
ncbi:hypothetical protein [Rhizobium sp. WSM1325]|uniref:hypothetical protein n=1 Tax=Rhizobium sp. WSM1325 TaxID=3444086 RepID=UPI0013E3503B|nr:hypothetical protein [Rhizobium leguminosarum]